MDYYIQHGHPERQERYCTHLDLIEDNWVVNRWGFVDLDYFIDCCVHFRKEAVTKALFNKRVFPNVCTFPDEVFLAQDE